MTRARGGDASSRLLLFGSAGLFVVSSLFPLAASVLDVNPLPSWVGVADVVIAGALIALGIVLMSKTPREVSGPVLANCVRAYRGLASAFLILLVLFFVAADQVRWNILLPGMAWRAWLLVMVLPSWITAWRSEQKRRDER